MLQLTEKIEVSFKFNKYIILLSLAIIFIASKATCQQSPIFTQYMFNGLIVNPAYAGSQESMSITAFYRKQWIGFNGSPSTQNLIAHAPLKNNKVALGAIFSNDNIGITHQTGFDGIYAYRISFSEKRKLSFGLQAGISKYSISANSAFVKDPNDPSFSLNQASFSSMYIGGGVYYYSEKFSIGISSPHIERVDLSNAFSKDKSKNYFLTSSYIFKVSPHFKIIPSTLIKMNRLVTQMDLNCSIVYEDVLWMGLSYRTFTSLNFIFRIRLTDQLSVGYAYDNTVNKLNAVTKGGHEIALNYNFTFFKSNIVTPRDF